MREKFPGWYPKKPEQIAKLWDTAIFVPDANVLLHCLRHTTVVRDELLRLFEALGDALWIPYQVGLEFQRNRLDVEFGALDPFRALRSPRAETAASIGVSSWELVESAQALAEGCYLHETGTLAFVNDGYFLHFLYDIRPAQLHTAKALREASAQMTEELSTATGAVPSLQCDWTSLDDEAFEELCYQLIFDNPKFDSDTIRKLGKSRSRDGGRDIVVHEVTMRPWLKLRKWIFQCKLVTKGLSLGATRLTDVGDMLEQYNAQGFGVITSAQMDATLYDKLDAICSKRQVEQYHLSVLELERALGRNRRVRQRFFPGS